MVLSAGPREFSAMPTGDSDMAQHFETLKKMFPTWREYVTLESLERVIEFDPSSFVDRIAPRAACLIAASGTDLVHPLDQIMAAYARCSEPRQLKLLPYAGLDLRFDPGWSEAMQAAVDWFSQHL